MQKNIVQYLVTNLILNNPVSCGTIYRTKMILIYNIEQRCDIWRVNTQS